MATILPIHMGRGDKVLVDSRGTPDINRKVAMSISVNSVMATCVLWFALHTELIKLCAT